jgi:hypothetical protein
VRQLQDPQDQGGRELAEAPQALQDAPYADLLVRLNLVDRLFAEITRQRIRRGVFRSVDDLLTAIEAWITARNSKTKPFRWTAKVDSILKKNARARRVLEAATAGTKH